MNSSDNTWTDVSEALGGELVVLDFCLNHDGDSSRALLQNDTAFVGWRYREGGELAGPTVSTNRIYAINFDHERFVSRMRDAHAPHSLSNQSAIYKQGCALAICINKILEVEDASKIVLVGHSMGGLAIREYLQRQEEGQHNWWVDSNNTLSGHELAKVVTIGTPHRGSNANVADLNLFGIKVWSEAVRDLRYFNSVDPEQYAAVYLFGGDESLLSSSYYNRDVNCDGDTADSIVGLNEESDGTKDNQSMSLPLNIRYTWITSDIGITDDDGLVALSRQWLFEGTESAPAGVSDTMVTDRAHFQETSDTTTILRGLDENDSLAFAYSIALGVPYSGRMNTRTGYDLADDDYFSFEITEASTLSIIADGDATGMQELALVDSAGGILATAAQSTLPMTLTPSVSAGMYYLRVSGTASDQTLSNPYEFEVGQLVPSVVSITPAPYSHNLGQSGDISVSFDVDLEQTTVNTSTVTVRGEFGGNLAGTVSYESATRTVRFSPVSTYKPGEHVQLSLSSDIKSTGSGRLLKGHRAELTAVTAPTSLNFETFSHDSLYFRQSYSFTTADLDDDGDLDVAVTSSGLTHVAYSSVSIHLNNGAGSFENSQNIPVAAYRIIPGDLDNDGDVDLIVASTDHSLTILRNSGSASFSTDAYYFAEGYGATYAIAGDITDDGYLDLVAASGGYVTVFRNNGTGSFADTLRYSVREYVQGISLADFDLDGDLDIVVASSASGLGFATVFYNDGWGRVDSSVELQAGNDVTAIATADFDEDGDPDILQVGGGGLYGAVALRNQGDGSFASQDQYLMLHVANTPLIIVKDIDGQNYVEMIQGNVQNSELVVTTPAQSFNSYSSVGSFPVDGYVSWANVADYDGDGDVDFLILDGSEGVLTLMPNEGEILPVLIQSFRAEAGQVWVILHWHVTSEVNTARFDVERSKMGDAFIEWITVGSVPGRGTATNPINYGLTDADVAPGRYVYRLRSIDRDGSSQVLANAEVQIFLPTSFRLDNVYPNPFNSSVTFRFSLPSYSWVTLEIFNSLGERVSSLLNEEREPGFYNLRWSPSSPSGVYFCRLVARNLQSAENVFSETRRFVHIK